MVPALFGKLATCIEPFVYAFNQPNIQKEIRHRFCRVTALQTNVSVNNVTRPATAASGRTRVLKRFTASAPVDNIHQQWQTTSL